MPKFSHHLVCGAHVLLAAAVALSTTPAPPRLTLWTSGTCPYAQRAQIALEEAGVPYGVSKVDLRDKSEAFLEAYRRAVPGGRGKVPVLEVLYHPGGKDEALTTLVESLPVAEYVCESYGTDASYPRAPEARALCRVLVEVQPFSGYLALLRRRDDPIDLADGISDLGKAVKDFDRFLEAHQQENNGGPFLFGEDFTFAEMAVAPFVQRCVATLRYFVDVDVREMCKFRNAPRALAFVEAVLKRPSVVATGVPEADLIDSTRTMLDRFMDAQKEAKKKALEEARALLEATVSSSSGGPPTSPVS